MKRALIVLLLASLLTSCASYRTNSDVSFDSTKSVNTDLQVTILETGLKPGTYTSMGMIEAVVKKLTLFHKSPTKEQVNAVLADKAQKLGADTVINVTYNRRMGVTTWGLMKGKGEAVKKK